jgi:steroid delta-isomerase-like uncharacterized protein
VDGMTEERAQEILSTYRAARNRPDLDLLDGIFAENAVVHDASGPGDIRGLEALKSFYAETHEGFPEFRIDWDDVIVASDALVTRWTIEATHAGNLRGLSPTGRHVRFSGVAIDRVADGRIVEEWVYFNLLDLLVQLGVAPAPAGGS